MDVGFVGGLVHVASLVDFVGAGSGLITAWYDQSGNGRTLTQPSTASQPRIINAGVLDVVANRPAIVFDGVDDNIWRADALGFTGSPAMTIANTYAAPFAGSQFLWGFGEAGSALNARWQLFAAGNSDTPLGLGITQGGAIGSAARVTWSGAAATQVAGVAVVQTKAAGSNTSAAQTYLNGSSVAATVQSTLNDGAVSMLNGVMAIGCASSLTSFGAQSCVFWAAFPAVLSGSDFDVLNAFANLNRI